MLDSSPLAQLPVLAVALTIGIWVTIRYTRPLFLATDSRSMHNLPGPPRKSFLKGNFGQLFAVNAWDFHKGLVRNYGNAVKLHGPMGNSQLFVYDPKALHHIVVKDQHVFEETVQFVAGNRAIFGHGLFSTLGDDHRRQRKMLNPLFSIAHMRGMVPIFYRVAKQLRNTLSRKVLDGPCEIDIHVWMTRTALELIGQSGLGHSFDPLTEDGERHPFCVAAMQFGSVQEKLMFARHYVFPLVHKIGSPAFQRSVVNFLPWKTLHQLRDIADVMHKTSVEIFESKKKAVLEQDNEALAKEAGGGKDLISVLMLANMRASDEDRLPDDEVIGQVSSFTFAATDTTTSALSRILWLLSLHPHVQAKLREEIREAWERDGDLEYDQLVALPYLDAVCRETLRLYPPISTIVREAIKDALLPLSKPIRGVDGTEMTEVVVLKGTRVYISVLSSNTNSDLWGPDVLEWKPERWLSPLPDSVNEAKIPGIYSNLMTFLGGGRACIGFKFSQLEMKTVLCVLLEEFEFKPPRDKEIFWKMPGITKATLLGDPEYKPHLPLIITRASRV